MILAHVLLAGAFVWIYSRGVEVRPWLPQGIRFGLAIAALTIVPTYIIYYVVQPMPGAVVVKQIVFDGILILILGGITAFLYREPSV
jgi:Zn-dependent protease